MDLSNFKPNKKLIYIFVAIILLPILILAFINLLPSNKQVNKLNKYTQEIINCNSALKNALDGNGINLTQAEEILTNQLTNLNNIKNDISSLEVNKENESTKAKLLETADYNITLYELALNLIRNPDDKDMVTTYNKYYTTYALLKNDLDSLNIIGITPNLSDESIKFFESSFNYFSTVLRINKANDIRIDMNKAYLNNIEKCIDEFNNISEDLEPAYIKIKQDNRNLDNLLNDVKLKKSKFNEIKNSCYSMTIPEDASNSYSRLQDTLNYYDLYITSLEHSIIVEQSSKSNNDENIAKNYQNSFSKYNDFCDSFKDLKTELDNFKKN